MNLRQDQSTNSPSLGLYKNGSVVCVFGVSQTWCHVRTEDGNVGFMLRENLSPLLEYNRVSAPTGDELEGSWFGVPGDLSQMTLCPEEMANSCIICSNRDSPN